VTPKRSLAADRTALPVFVIHDNAETYNPTWMGSESRHHDRSQETADRQRQLTYRSAG